MKCHISLKELSLSALILIFFACFFVSCKKVYKVEIEEIEVWRGAVKRVTKNTSTSTFEAKDNEEAAEIAYRNYAVSLKVCCESDKNNHQYLWIPVDYKIYDKDGRTVSKNLLGLDRFTDLLISEEVDSIYYNLLGYTKYVGTPYGIRHPKPCPF